MGLKLVQKPSAAAVSLEVAKSHLRVTFDDDNTIISSFVDAAADAAQKFMGRAIKPQVWDFVTDEFPDDEDFIEIPLPPLIEVIGIYYKDAVGVEQTLDSAEYFVDSITEPGRIYIKDNYSWPTTSENEGSVRVRFRCGYNDTDSPQDSTVPASITSAILLYLGSIYENRESVVVGAPPIEVPWSWEALLRQYRVHLAMA